MRRPSPRGKGYGVLAFFLLLTLAFSGCATIPDRKAFDVTLEVDFGPAQKPSLRRTLQVERGATPEGLVAKVFPSQRGAVCCDPREVATIDGVAADPAANRWWTVSLNGSKKVSPYKTKLKSGDVVRWEYRQSVQ
ncbi:MAG: DUF4430 domain-containing protein [Candidatus Omnitrophica bacterium]|nr:DUF4430 domain-containing protein [Candidatus Omnitrophota bacterium]